MQQWSILNRIVQVVQHSYAVFTSKQTPLYVKLVLGTGLLYVLSPLDLIPEWVPFFGILDDLALAALLIAWANRFELPEE